jgi:hypothetical protein
MRNQDKKYHPILFSTPMVQAILEGRKTQTRRIIKNQPPINSKLRGMREDLENKKVGFYFSDGTGPNRGFWPSFEEDLYPPYEVGDVLWVRETFIEWPENTFQYFANTALGEELGKWKPSIHMPKVACRIFLKVKSIRAERLQDISNEDARDEGVDFVEGINGNLYYNYLTLDYGCNELFSFMTLWQKINGLDSWSFNPFVWVYEFEKIEKPNDFVV